MGTTDLDDILVCGRDHEEHNGNLDKGFQILSDADLRLKQEKCSLEQTSVTYLGHVIDEHGLRPVQKKVDAIQHAPESKNVTELLCFFRKCIYY